MTKRKGYFVIYIEKIPVLIRNFLFYFSNPFATAPSPVRRPLSAIPPTLCAMLTYKSFLLLVLFNIDAATRRYILYFIEFQNDLT